ncbi:response regulator transcription factor [Marivirga sp. S37H4]|uniref:Response regulator transcription factor n=1 Tax=Marivirga aurantiaca TaxID=2802615 RepID=A0A935CCK3_9BACT|nr:LytTR family DNA-binding domain-containing protein [Marivirga aurantiaca]MBK6266098.1 response regulator transcription factor [Marivirga aurantiaca]
MNILIIEDESLNAKTLVKLLNELLPEAFIHPVLMSVKKAKQWFATNPPPELIFADIQLSDGISFEIFEEFPPKCPVIFTTAYDQYALKAFEVHSIDYLLKPIAKPELEKALDKFQQRMTVFPHQELADLVRKMNASQPHYKERFLVNLKNASVLVMAREIAYFCKEELIFVYKTNGERFLTDFHTMDELEQLLNPAQFFRANRQFIIHLQSVDKIKNTYKGLTVFLKHPNAISIDMSREKVTTFKNWLTAG